MAHGRGAVAVRCPAGDVGGSGWENFYALCVDFRRLGSGDGVTSVDIGDDELREPEVGRRRPRHG